MTFEAWLRAGLESDAVTRRRARKLQKILDMRPGRSRARILGRLERHAATHLKVAVVSANPDEATGIDWGSVDWAKVFSKLIEFLLAILPFILL